MSTGYGSWGTGHGADTENWSGLPPERRKEKAVGQLGKRRAPDASTSSDEKRHQGVATGNGKRGHFGWGTRSPQRMAWRPRPLRRKIPVNM